MRQTRQTSEQLVNKITAKLTVLYPDIIKYMLYSNTIRDKSEAYYTNYTGQRVSQRKPWGTGAVTKGSGGEETRTELGVGGASNKKLS